MSDLIQITTTSDDPKELEQIAAALIEHQLAACCQIGGPIASWYLWEGKLESTTEWTCTIKTTKHLFAEVESMIRKHHHYQIPQITANAIQIASPDYEQWVRNSLATQ